MRALAGEVKQVLDRHDLDYGDREQVLGIVVADELSKTAMDAAMLGGKAPSREGLHRQVVARTRAFASAVLMYAQWATPEGQEDELAWRLDDYLKEDEGDDDGFDELLKGGKDQG